MRIGITGASGMIGGALGKTLQQRGDQVVRLGRDEFNPKQVGPLDAVVNLAGAPIAGKRWTDRYQQEIRSSRVDATARSVRLVRALGPDTDLINGSAVGYYGDRGRERLTETSRAGAGFLPDVVLDWEQATNPAQTAGHRVVKVRTGIVLSTRGGALQRMLPLLKLGVAGPLGNGRQIWPWITLNDEVRALLHVIDGDVSGPVNLAAPACDEQRDVVSAMADQLGRPSVVPAPKFALRLALGGFASDILASQWVVPDSLMNSGFAFEQPDVSSAAHHLLS